MLTEEETKPVEVQPSTLTFTKSMVLLFIICSVHVKSMNDVSTTFEEPVVTKANDGSVIEEK